MRRKFAVPACVGLAFAAAIAAPAAYAQEAEQPAAPAVTAECIEITLFNGRKVCITTVPEDDTKTGSLGYGSLGTGSLLNALSQFVLTGSNALSLEIPLGTGSYAPGSTGSYGPEASVGQLSSQLMGSLISGSVGGS